MTSSIYIRNAIISLLEKNMDVYYIEAPDTASYPYVVFEARKTVARDGIKSYNIEFNVWDKHKTWSRAETIADTIETILDRENITSELLNMRLYEGYKQHVEDPDKQIRRIQVTMDAIITERR